MLIGEAALAFFHHLTADVANNGLGAGASGAQEAAGYVAGAARDVDQERGRRARGRKPINGRSLPKPVHAARHQVVHEVIAGGHAAEDGIDETLKAEAFDFMIVG